MCPQMWLLEVKLFNLAKTSKASNNAAVNLAY